MKPAIIPKTKRIRKGPNGAVEKAAAVSEADAVKAAAPKRSKFRWNDCQEYLLEWLCVPENYNRWRSTTVSGRVTGDSKTQIAEELAELLRSKGFPDADRKKVQNKIEVFEGSYRRAVSCLNGTGCGIDDKDITRGITTIEQKVKTLCPFYDRLKEVFGERPGMVPPYTAGSQLNPDELPAIIEEDILEEHTEDNEAIVYEDPLDLANNSEQGEAVVAQDVDEDVERSAVESVDSTALPQPKVNLGTNIRAREKTSLPPLALSPLQKHLAPSQQRKLTKCGKNSNAASSLDVLLSERKTYWDKKMDLNVKRQKFAEEKSVKDHAFRMRELAVREKEAEAAKEQAKSQTLMMQFLVQKMQKSTDGM